MKSIEYNEKKQQQKAEVEFRLGGVLTHTEPPLAGPGIKHLCFI